ncbi:hypothetical protein VK792_06600 [Mesobacterium sp. TK19101]|uniref:Uncharacterized protein n=1 Tax=Mesobacterium hydrothermale TaxID=3111907 RepID=A0ABU6HHL5_9RHOB|nr:hypothetical protein [Mesobacterium sp. TK19101]MEC3860948.1 hypothetical protein [Mesobacterium sp. TK19101]
MPTEVSLYIYGNSLVNYAEGSDWTNVPVWLDMLAMSSGNDFAASGGYGFLRQFADRAEPGSEWGFNAVEAAWDADTESFSASSVDTVLITPNNFIQDVSPNTDYYGDTRSPVEATLDVVADTQAALPGARIFVYEGWADMAAFADTVPETNAALQAYHDYNTGAYHDWYVDYVAQINAADPDANVELIPVASVLSELLTTTLSDIPPEELYVDSAPHGTETIYFLASLVTYTSIYGEAPPTDFDIPGLVHPSVAEHYAEVLRTIEDAVNGDAPDLADDAPVIDDVEDPAPQDEELIVREDAPPPDPVTQPEPATDPEPDPGPQPTVGALAQADSYQVGTGQTVYLDVLANDTPGGELVYTDTGTLGEASVDGDRIAYTPDNEGTDAFSYVMRDAEGGFHEAWVTVSVGGQTPLESEQVVQDDPGTTTELDLERPVSHEAARSLQADLDVDVAGRFSITLQGVSDGTISINGTALQTTLSDDGETVTAQSDLGVGTHDLRLGFSDLDNGHGLSVSVHGPGDPDLSAQDDSSDDSPATSPETVPDVAEPHSIAALLIGYSNTWQGMGRDGGFGAEIRNADLQDDYRNPNGAEARDDAEDMYDFF